MAPPGTLFEYLAAFVTIVVALAIGDMVTSLHRLLRARRRVRWRPLPLLLAAFVLLALFTTFFEIWLLTEIDRISYLGLVGLMAPTIATFLLASAVLPDEVPPEGLDLDAFYFGERRYLFAVMGVAVALNIATAVPRDQFWMLQDPGFLWGFYVPLNALLFVAIGAMWKSARPWVHWLGLAAMFAAAAIGFSSWKVRGEPAVTPAAIAVASPAAAPGR